MTLRLTLTLWRYFGMRFLVSAVAVFAGVLGLVALLDSVELMRRTSGHAHVTALLVFKTSIFRVPMVTERIMPFCVLVGAMSCYLNLSRRNELVIARAAGMSAWQFVAPAIGVALLLGTLATAVYNPVAAYMLEQSKLYEAEIFGKREFGMQETGFWVRQRSPDGQSIINARSALGQGLQLTGVTVFTFDHNGHYQDRIEAKSAVLRDGAWQLSDAKVYPTSAAPQDFTLYTLKTNLSPEQVRESFATAETLAFWELPDYIATAENAGLSSAAYRLQYQKLLSRPFLLASMVLLAASFSLRFFRMGGVQTMVLGGILSGFLLYVLSKVTEDMSKAELLSPVVAAWAPVFIGGLTGFLVLLYQEDG
jgi:lipopolysaccharide export system permease protein